MTCMWPLPESVEHLPEEWSSAPAACQEYGQDMASRSLTLLTGGRVGNCPVTVRPNVQGSCACGPSSHDGNPYGMYPTNWNGSWYNGPYPCGRNREVELPAPVGRIDEVKVNGVVLDPSDYRIDGGYLLVWQGSGDSPFPHTQDPVIPDTEAGTMSVTYVNTYLPGPSGSLIMSILAFEFLLACLGKQCRLPDSVTTIVRQGLTMQITPGHWPDGKTGISEVDSFIALWNPRGMLVPSQVWSPDLPVARTVGG